MGGGGGGASIGAEDEEICGGKVQYSVINLGGQRIAGRACNAATNAMFWAQRLLCDAASMAFMCCDGEERAACNDTRCEAGGCGCACGACDGGVPRERSEGEPSGAVTSASVLR